MKRTVPRTRAQFKNMTKNEYEKLNNEDEDIQNIELTDKSVKNFDVQPEVKLINGEETSFKSKKSKRSRINKTSSDSESNLVQSRSESEDQELSDEDKDDLVKEKLSGKQDLKKDFNNIALLMFLYLLQVFFIF